MKRDRQPMASSPLVALAEQASGADVEHAIIVTRTKQGDLAVHPMDGSDPVMLAGMMAWATVQIMSDDDDAD